MKKTQLPEPQIIQFTFLNLSILFTGVHPRWHWLTSTDHQMRTFWHPVHCPMPKEVTFWDAAYNLREQHSWLEGVFWSGRVITWTFPWLGRRKATSSSFLEIFVINQIFVGAFIPPRGPSWNLWGLVLLVGTKHVFVDSAVEYWTQNRSSGLVLQGTSGHRKEFFGSGGLLTCVLIFQRLAV